MQGNAVSDVGVFAQPNGAPVWINGAAGGTVRAALPDEYALGVQSVIAAGRVKQGIRENVAQVRAIIRGRGGKARIQQSLAGSDRTGP